MTSSLPGALQVYKLCERCALRQPLRPEAFEVVEGGACYVCGGLLDLIPGMGKKAARLVKRHDFRTFAVGVSMPEGVQEREDELRSDLKLKGTETIKTQASNEIARILASATRRRVEKMRPDVTVLADFGSGEPSATSRPVYFYGRYSKPAKVSQRRELCRHCSGAGCPKCRMTGLQKRPSVEGEVGKKLGGYCGSEKVVFTWLGSEDRESKVLSPGRPFVAEVKNPVKRKVPRKFTARFRGGQVAVSSGRMLKSKPVGLPKFRFVTRIWCRASSKLEPERVSELRRAFRRAEVEFDRPHDRPTVKRVYRAKGQAEGRSLVVEAEMDGGLPVKRFVSGELVSPSVSEVLGVRVFCKNFDILRVTQIGALKF
ncbi:MAG: hypothetical protein HY247_06370 [archaeon]|nr:MAG: hypothetical protein HY247_06370 [archaeon]